MPELLIGVIVGGILVALVWWVWGSTSTAPSSPAIDPESTAPTPLPSAEELRRLSEALDLIDDGVVYFSETGTVVFANERARRMFSDIGIPVGPVLRNGELMSVVRRAQSSRLGQEATVSLWPARQAVSVRAWPVGEAEVVAVLRDVTEEQRLMLVRRQFVVSASHEMKTPVTVIQALAEAGQEALAADDLDAARKFVANLEDETARLGRLVQDLLDLSRVEDPSNIPRTPVELGHVASEVIEEYEGPAKAKALELKASLEPELWIRGDPSQLRLVLKNLVDNAVRYTSEGRVLVEVFHAGGEVVARVADTGIGIPLSSQSRVFERFFRVDAGRDRARGGTGLGLSIVKHVVDLHGGRVTLDSELGEGSTFTVHFPAVEVPDA